VIKSSRQLRPQRLPQIKEATTGQHYRVLGVDGPSSWFRGELAVTPNCSCEWTEWSGALRDQLHRISPDRILIAAGWRVTPSRDPKLGDWVATGAMSSIVCEP
jgi:hypothetical protein